MVFSKQNNKNNKNNGIIIVKAWILPFVGNVKHGKYFRPKSSFLYTV